MDCGRKKSHPVVCLRLALFTLLIFFGPRGATARAPQANLSSIEAFLKSTLKTEDRIDAQARGDLNGDGLEDWAGVIRRQTANASPTYQLYILARLPHGGYRIAERSKEEEIPGMGCCWVEDLEIRHASLYVQNNAKDVSSMKATTHQFKLSQGKWRLVGLKIYETNLTPEAEASTETDMNLLTGAVSEKRQRGDHAPVTTRRRRRFATYILKDYDFSSSFGHR